jgi:hypothetical protein
MTKNNLLALPLLIMLNFSIQAQSVVNGAPYKVIDAFTKLYYNDGENVLTIKIDRDLYTLQALNANTLKETARNEFDDFPKGAVREFIKQINGRVFLFYSHFDKSSRIEQLFYRELFIKTATMSDHKKLLSVDSEIAGSLQSRGYFNYFTTDKFDIQESKDGKRLLITYRLKPLKRNDAENHDVIGFHVFDENLNPIWAKQATMPYTEKKMNNLDYTVDSQGNVYELAMVYKDNTTDAKKKGDEDANYRLELLKFKAQTGTLEKTPMEIKGKFLSNGWLYETTDGEIVCAGFYHNGERNSGVKGVFSIRIGKESKGVLSANQYEIPLAILNQNASAREIKKNDKKEEKDEVSMNNLKLQQILINDDGSLVLVGEQEYSITTSYVDANGKYRTSTRYYTDDILLTKIDSNGKLVWMKKLPKRQSGGAFSQLSYRYMKSGNDHVFLYVDNEKNHNLSDSDVPVYQVNVSTGFLTAYVVGDAKGDVKKMPITSLLEINGVKAYQFTPQRILPLNESEFVFEIYKKKKEDLLIKVKIK